MASVLGWGALEAELATGIQVQLTYWVSQERVRQVGWSGRPVLPLCIRGWFFIVHRNPTEFLIQ